MMSFEKPVISKILIVGGSVTGSAAASLIKHEASVNIEIWERLDRIGTQYKTYPPHSDAPSGSVDCGAQCISITLESIRNQAKFYHELLEKDLLLPIGQKIANFRKLSETKSYFVAPGGTVSLIRHFIEKADCELRFDRQVEEINLNEKNKVWEVKTSKGTIAEFDVVILTIPVPEVLKLQGNFMNINQDDEVKVAMEQVKYSPCFAVVLMYNEKVKYLEELPTDMQYFHANDGVIHFMSVENQRKGECNKFPHCVIIQSTTSFAEKCSDMREEEIQKQLIDHCKCLLPELPEPSSVELHHWTYAKLVEPYIDNPGCIVLNEYPCLICGGDSFTSSNFNGCIDSALKIVEELLKRVKFVKGLRRNSKKCT